MELHLEVLDELKTVLAKKPMTMKELMAVTGKPRIMVLPHLFYLRAKEEIGWKHLTTTGRPLLYNRVVKPVAARKGA